VIVVCWIHVQFDVILVQFVVERNNSLSMFFYYVCLQDQDGCQILAVLQDAAGSKISPARIYSLR